MPLASLRARAAALDAADPLAGFRARFALPAGLIYLDGNSLGPLPQATPARLEAVLRREWGERLIASWADGAWLEAPRRVGGLIAGLIGAGRHEVIACDTVSVNLFKLAAAALALNPERRTILTEAGNFPTDAYVLAGVARMAGAHLKVVERSDVLAALDGEVALVVLTHAHYRSAILWDMAAVTAAARAAGALMLWDLSHSTGALAVDLGSAGADLAVGCGYKYLNGGPGAPAFAYVAERHQDRVAQPIAGWMGHAAPFAFEAGYRPAAGVARLLAGTPSPLALAALEEGVALAAEAGAAAAAKVTALTGLFLAAMDACGLGERVEPAPMVAGELWAAGRGGHVTLRLPDAAALVRGLAAGGLVGDFRPPDGARFGFSPLFLRHGDAVEAAARIALSLGGRGA